MRLRALLFALLAVVLVGCSEEPEPFYPPDPNATAPITAYDPELEPSAGVLPLIPGEATQLRVTDFDQLRLTLGFGALDGSSAEQQRARFWRQVGGTAALSAGLLRPVDDQLRDRFSIGQDDVAWEAHYSGDDVDGWVIGFHTDLQTRRIRRAISAGVGPLDGAVLAADHNIVSSAEAPGFENSWANDPDLPAVAGREANATWIQRGCVEVDEIYGAGTTEQLGGQTQRDVANLRELTAFSVSFGSELVTVQLGEGRPDAFLRLRLASHLPELEPPFGRVFSGGVASPSDGTLGYRLNRPRLAATWVAEGRIPFAACRS